MERTEPTFVPEWLKSSGSLSTTTHQVTSSLHSDEQGVSKSVRNKSLVNSSDNELGRPSVSDRTTTSSYFRRTSNSNGSAHLRSYSSFGRNHRDRDWDKDNNRHRDYSDSLSNFLPSRFEKDTLRRTHSSVSGKHGESWPRKVATANKSSHNNGGTLLSGSGGIKTAFERDFPTLGAEEKQGDLDIGRVPSPGLGSAIQSLPIGNAVVIGGDGWTSALAEVPVIVGSNGSSTSVVQPVQANSISAATTGRNMAETLAHGPPRAQTAPQLTVGTQRLEELAVKQSRQLIPMTPFMPKALALNSSDKPKPKVGQSQLQNSHPHTPRPLSVKSDVSKTSTVGKLLVLKPSRERNGISPTAKDSLSPTGGGTKLPNSPLAAPPMVVERKPSVEKRPSSQAQSRNNFFNLMRKKSMTSNSSVAPESGSSDSTNEKLGEPQVAPPPGPKDEAMSEWEHQPSEAKVDLTCNGDACGAPVRSNANNGKNGSGPDAILYPEEEEARFLRSLGWDETAEEEEGLTEEEISSFYRNVSKYLNLKPASKFLKGTEPKLKLLTQMGEDEAKLDS